MRIKNRDIDDFLRDLALLLEAGQSLSNALSLLERGQERPAMTHFIKALAEKSRQGHDVVACLQSQPRYFPPVLLDLLAEASDKEAQIETLKQIALFRERYHFSDFPGQGQAKSSLAYPLFVAVVAIAVFSILMMFVIPVFAELFADFGADLPALTNFVIGISQFFAAYGLFVIIGLFILVLYYRWGKYEQGRDFWLAYPLSRLALWIPRLGRLIGYQEVARMLYTWHFFQAQGKDLKQAIAASAALSEHPVFARVLTQVSKNVQAGTQVSDALEKQPLLPKKVAHISRVLEQSGQWSLLADLALGYQHQYQTQSGGSTRVFEGILLVLIWIVVMVLVLAMYLPIFKIGSVI